MHIIPAIDILNGKAVQLTQGKLGTEKIYGDPIDFAKKFSKFEILHIIDLDGTLSTGKDNIEILKEIRKNVKARIHFGGGIRTHEKFFQICEILNDNDKIILGTFAMNLKNLEKLKEYKNKIIVAIDSKNGKIAIKGWKETTNFSTLEFMKNFYDYAWGFLYTDITVEGKLEGINFENISEVVKNSKLPIIVSGGITSYEDIEKIKTLNPYGVVVGKAIYEGRIRLNSINFA